MFKSYRPGHVTADKREHRLDVPVDSPSRSAEFGLGAVYKHADGSEHNAINAVGGTRDNAQAKMLPPEENPVTPEMWAEEKRYSHSDQDW